jgi:hypothetical protein
MRSCLRGPFLRLWLLEAICTRAASKLAFHWESGLTQVGVWESSVGGTVLGSRGPGGETLISRTSIRGHEEARWLARLWAAHQDQEHRPG